jgi:hypothetical protein
MSNPLGQVMDLTVAEVNRYWMQRGTLRAIVDGDPSATFVRAMVDRGFIDYQEASGPGTQRLFSLGSLVQLAVLHRFHEHGTPLSAAREVADVAVDRLKRRIEHGFDWLDSSAEYDDELFVYSVLRAGENLECMFLKAETIADALKRTGWFVDSLRGLCRSVFPLDELIRRQVGQYADECHSGLKGWNERHSGVDD